MIKAVIGDFILAIQGVNFPWTLKLMQYANADIKMLKLSSCALNTFKWNILAIGVGDLVELENFGYRMGDWVI